MSEPDHHDQTPAAPLGEDGLEALFAAARAEPDPPLAAAFMQRLLADAAATQIAMPTTAPPIAAAESAAESAVKPVVKPGTKPSALAGFWIGLQDIFGGKAGIAGAAFASCAAFAIGIVSPDTATDLVGLTALTELAALDSEADPTVLWAEE